MTTQQTATQRDETAENPDVIVIGAGMGGGAAAFRLCELGLKVLLIEKGNANFDTPQPEMHGTEPETPGERLAAGMWPNRITMQENSKMNDIWLALGCGVGGSTLLFGAALGRFERIDFEPRRTPSDELVSWPFDYDEFQPYYLQAEKLLKVRGTVDPQDRSSEYSLLEPPAMNDCDRHFFSSMTSKGLQPYRQHVGIAYVPGCTECGGHICPNKCKSDARTCFVDPAEKSGNLTVWHDCEVTRIDADESQVSAVDVVRQGENISVTAKVFVLAAGAIGTPVILQKSKGPDWPNGIGNQNDLVGRNLMFHTSDFFAIWPRGNYSRGGATRTIATRALYSHENETLGELQSTGMTAGFWEILHFLHIRFQKSPIARFRFLAHFLRIPAYIAVRLFKDATVFANIIEDNPYRNNRVCADDSAASGIRIYYKIPEELRTRVKKFRRLLKASLKPHFVTALNRDANLNLGHSCGTCRAGNDPQSSVLDSNCKVHGVSNLYVADSSFMPTSGGTNPSLTIAANALRVAGVIGEQIAESRRTASNSRS